MKFTIEINCGNSSFRPYGEEDNADAVSGREMEFILHHIARDIGESDWRDGESYSIFDTNGNKVGEWKFSE